MRALDQVSECVKRAVVTVRNRAPREKVGIPQARRREFLLTVTGKHVIMVQKNSRAFIKRTDVKVPG
eukprot:907497-Rhodomonas_salina.1